MISNENKILYIAKQCQQAGFTVAGIAGVIANIEAESAFNPHNLQDTYERAIGYNDESYTAAVDSGTYQNFVYDSAGYGLAQWTSSDRKDNMLKFHRSCGKSIGDFQTQVAWLIVEMKVYGGGRAYRTCTTSDNPYNCGYEMCKYYEICDNLEASSQYRGGKAQEWYNWLLSHMSDQSSISVESQSTSSQSIQSVINPIPAIQIGKIELRTIDQGIDGWPEVWLLQAALKIRGSNVVSNGTFGSSLTEKVKQFQKLAFPNDPSQWDGVVGPLTWAALLAFL